MFGKLLCGRMGSMCKDIWGHGQSFCISKKPLVQWSCFLGTPVCVCDVISTLEEQQANCGNGTWQFVKYFPKEKKTERIESVISKRAIANVWCQRPKPNLYTIIRLLNKMYLCYCGLDSISILNVFFHEYAAYINSKLWFLKLCDEVHQLLEELPDLVNTYFQNDQYKMLQYRGHAAAGR